MTLETSFELRDDYLLAVVTGDWTSTWAAKTLQGISKKMRQHSVKRVLIDTLHVSEPHIELDRYLLGRGIATHFPRPMRLAILYPAKSINKFVEDTAVNRGANVLVCAERAEALSWLLSDKPSTAG